MPRCFESDKCPACQVWSSRNPDRGLIAGGLVNWRLWALSFPFLLIEASMYGILFWAPLLLDAIFVSSSPSHDLSHQSLTPTNISTLFLMSKNA